MREAYTFTKKSQINVVFNQKTEKSSATPFPIDERVTHEPLEKLESKLNRLVGMEEIKYMVRELYAWLYIYRKREEAQLKVQKQSFHMLFKGNPGTGKTTVARLLSDLFREMEILPKGHLIEAERADLVGEYIGQTAQKTRDLVKRSLGGVLFVDEAYSLSRGGEKDFGKEAIDTLVKQMEDHKDEFILILAGYSDEMDDFLRMNPGLPSRFPMILSFPDYSGMELLDIAKQMIRDREYSMTAEAQKKLFRLLQHKIASNEPHFSNGRYVRNVIEKMIRQQAVRLVRENSFDRDALLTLRACDLTLEDGSLISKADEA
ncbi:AAA family ATPase [Sporolactobacillus laevolacticus]|uniref:AAA family ATPase n=1 Tax=Sporolactobacillus laevolacticus TaxID=33018 RepID=UPI0025B3FFA0|nr:AAA family ATPase [Sporolactobacillus laevolacticus]MDN3953911.1 AAA family ATPase [Sporolactobacillus laevolacticus]